MPFSLTLKTGQAFTWESGQRKPQEIDPDNIASIAANEKELQVILAVINVPFVLPTSRWRGEMAKEIFSKL